MNNKYIAESKRIANDNKSMNTEDKSVRLSSGLFSYNKIWMVKIVVICLVEIIQGTSASLTERQTDRQTERDSDLGMTLYSRLHVDTTIALISIQPPNTAAFSSQNSL